MDGRFDAQPATPPSQWFRQFMRLSMILLFLCSCCVIYGADPFLRSDSIVVLLSGLPGDLESESTYRDQLRSWLDILESAHPKQIFALTDNPESISVPATASANTVPIKVFSASRSNFLFLGSILTNRLDSLVVIELPQNK